MLGKRKVYLCAFVITLGAFLLVGRLIDQNIWLSLMEITIVTFVGGNATEHLSKVFGRRKDE